MRRKGDSVARAQQKIAETRERMSETAAAIEARVSGAVENVKDGLDPTRLVQEHPWPALAAALVVGVALSATRADEKLADTAVDAAKRASSAAAESVRDLGDAVASRLHNDGDRKIEDQNDGLVERAKVGVARVVQAQANELKTELARAAEDIAWST